MHTLVAAQLNLPPEQVRAAIRLMDDGNTVPFIARYRKEATGGLDEEHLRQINHLLNRLRALEERRETILKSLRGQGLLTPELERKLLAAGSRTELEDLYRPYRPTRHTRADVARKKGLQGLADLIIQQPVTDRTAEELAAPFLADSTPTPEEALAGARDIVAETISNHPDVRQETRAGTIRWGSLHAAKTDAEDPREVYREYYAFEMRVNRLRPHQILAIARGER